MEDPKLRAIDYRVKVWLLLVSLAVIALMVSAALRENLLADWYRYRRQYADVLAEKATDARGQAAARDFELRIVQNYVPELGAADRCATCHAGVEDPRMRDEAAPFTTHPGRYLQIHDPARFGCTVCHRGQGRATETADAHGHVAHWDYPMLARQFVKTSCTQCHLARDLYGDDGLIAQADGPAAAPGGALVEQGRRLASQDGCLGCHMLNDKGGTLGPELTRVGSKTRHDFDFSHFDRDEPREVPTWLRRHFLDPAAVSPGSIMPAVADDQEADALTAYMLSLRGQEIGAYVHRQSERDDAAPETGEHLYARYCASCHGAEGRAGNVPAIQAPALNNLDTLAAASDDYYRFIIANGRSNSRMPAWGEGHGNLTREEIDRVVAHMRSWQPEGSPIEEVSSESGDPQRGRAYYTGLCAGCHGTRGEGGIGTALRTSTFLAVADDRFLAESILRGRPGTAMPSWKQLSRQAVDDILAFIRSWQPVPPTFDEVSERMEGVSAPENARIGKFLYENNCVSCHGIAGEGGIGPSLSSSDFLRAVDDRYLYRAITRGRPATAMPAWRDLSADDIGALIAYLRSFQRGGPLELTMPVPPGDYAVGEVHYRVSCAGCHGDQGIGGSAPRLASPTFLRSVSDGILFHWIAYGRAFSPMKGFLTGEQGVTQLTSSQIADVIAYLRYLGTRDDLPILRTGVGNPRLGHQLYQGTCASCHGPTGEGASAPQLNNPTLLRSASDGFLAATIVLGRVGTAMQPMVHGHEGLGQIRPENVADVIAYLRLWDYPQSWRTTRQVPERTDRSIAAGGQMFAAFCAGCHGPNGRGVSDGSGYYAPALNNPEFLAAASDGFLLATIARGRSGTPMRGFGKGSGGIAALESSEINDIVSFLRSWQVEEEVTHTGGMGS